LYISFPTVVFGILDRIDPKMSSSRPFIPIR